MKKLLLILILLTSLGLKAQDRIIPDRDNVPNCQLMSGGKYINMETDDRVTSGYYAIIKDGVEIEYVEDGKYYLKSTLAFKDKCTYKMTIVECTIPDFIFQKGDEIYSEIVETSTKHNLIKMRSKLKNGSWVTVVFRKIE